MAAFYVFKILTFKRILKGMIQPYSKRVIDPVGMSVSISVQRAKVILSTTPLSSQWNVIGKILAQHVQSVMRRPNSS